MVAGAASVLLLGACGDDARYAGPPDDGLGVDMYVAGAALDAGGDVVITGRSGVNVLAPDGDGRRPLRRVTVPAAAKGDGGELHGLSTDATGRTWVLVGRNRVPVRVSDGAVHPGAGALPDVYEAADSVPGAAGTDPRTVTAVGVVDDRTLLAGSRGRDGGSVLLHRVTGGTATLVAGRSAASRTGPERLAADEPPGSAVRAVDVDLDQVAAVVALPGGDALVVTSFRDTDLPSDYPQRLTLFVLHGETLRLLPVENLFAGSTLPWVIGSVLDDGRVVLEARRATGAAAPVPAVVTLDVASGETSLVADDLPTTVGDGVQIMVARPGADRLTVVTPRGGDAEDDDNVDAIRITTADLPKDG